MTKAPMTRPFVPRLTPEQRAALKRKKAFATQMKANPTPAEDLLWRHLDKRKLDGYPFRRQVVRLGYILDFHCKLVNVAVEVDGGYHLRPDQAFKDKLREQRLATIGIKVIRFTNEEVLEDLPYVLLAISNFCHQFGPEPWTEDERAAWKARIKAKSRKGRKKPAA